MYIGNTPAENYASFETQTFLLSVTSTNYSLSHAVTNENDIRLVINNVVQQPGSGKAYTASGTTLTLTSATVNTDFSMYCVYLGRALQTVNPPNASVGTAQLADSSVTSAKLASGVGGTNTPYFYASQSTATTIANASATKVTMDNEVLDSAGAFASSRFTVPSGQGGKYFFHFSVALNTSANASIVFPILYVNGSEVANGVRIRKYHGGSDGTIQAYAQSAFYNASAGNYFEVYFYQNAGSSKSTYNSSQDTFFFGYKIIE